MAQIQKTLSQLITEVRQRADMTNSQFVTDAELTNYINNSYYELYDMLVSAYGEDYFVAPALTFQTNGTDYKYALPNGANYSSAPALYKFLGLDLSLGNTPDSWVTIRNFKFAERNRYSVPNFQSFYGVTNLRYRLEGSDLVLTPTPQGGQTLRLWYIPQLIPLSAPSDVMTPISGWDEYVIVDAAMKAKDKQESDVTVLLNQKLMLKQRIEGMSQNRDAGFPQRVGDTQYTDFWYPNGQGNNFGAY